MEQWKRKRLGASTRPRVTPRKIEASPSAKQALSIYDALRDFIRYQRDEKQASPYTLDAYERDLLRFASERDAAGKNVALVAVTAEDVRGHMHGLLDRHLSPATVRRALYALGSFFGWAVKWDLLAKNPGARVTVPKRERVREVRALSKRERALLIAAADELAATSRRALDAQAPLLVRLLLKTGLRRGEALGLRLGDIDVEARELFVRYGKGKKSRRVPLEDEDLLQRLAAVSAARLQDGGAAAGSLPVFVNAKQGRLSPSLLYKVFHRVLRHAELFGMGITPHSLRHTFGSVLCARGVPVPYVKDLLGHADIGSTMVYVHSTSAALRGAVKKLAE